MNPIEDEAVVAQALLSAGSSNLRLVPIDDLLPKLRRLGGVSKWRVRHSGEWYDNYSSVPDALKQGKKILPSMFPPSDEDAEALQLQHCMRVLPHMQDTGGFFIACIEKGSEGDVDDETQDATLADIHDVSEKAMQDPEQRAANAEVEATAEADEAEEAAKVEIEEDAAKAEEAEEAKEEASEPSKGASVDAMEASDPAAQTADVVSSIDVGLGMGASHADGESATSRTHIQSSAGTSSSPLCSQAQTEEQPTKSQTKTATAAAHVLAQLHCGMNNKGKYDMLFSLQPSFLTELRAFLGLADSFPLHQLVTRSLTGKAIFLIAAPIFNLLQADFTGKFKLVNTGTRVLERLDYGGLGFQFRSPGSGCQLGDGGLGFGSGCVLVCMHYLDLCTCPQTLALHKAVHTVQLRSYTLLRREYRSYSSAAFLHSVEAGVQVIQFSWVPTLC